MSPRDADLDPVLESLLRPPRVKRQASPELRARALSRARTYMGVRGTNAPSWRDEPRAVVSIPSTRTRARRIALVTALISAVGAVGAVAAYRVQSADLPAAAGPARAARPVSAPAVRVATVEPPAVQSPIEPPAASIVHVPRVKSATPLRSVSADGRFTAELKLLQRAQLAYTRREFSGALMLIGEHAHRFPRGHLAEEREALRVRSLQGAGRVGDAHRSAAAFATRFPRSILLPRVDNLESE